MPSFKTPEPIDVFIDVTTGHVVLRASDRADTVVEVRPTDPDRDDDVQAAEQTRVEYTDGRLSVRTPKSRIRAMLGRYPSIEVTVDLPTDSRVDARALANFRGEGRLGASVFHTTGFVRLDRTGRLRLHTAAGDVSVGRSTGHTAVTTSTGKIRLGEIDGTAVVKTSNGDITVGEVTGDVRLNTANGDIIVDRALGAVTAKTAYGSVRIGEVVRGSVVLDTNFGEVELGVAHGTAAWLDVNSRHGTVRSDLDAVEGPGEAAETVEVRARTGFGDIVIRRP
ncbi:MAG TPA: DUF4097 family beta strand repeat-containing protein [Thermomonospora sp.]|nr:DUF4097 family beta strand repeat-containing protein [Thermomonospora sp.]